jgi:hypothetical protein
MPQSAARRVLSGFLCAGRFADPPRLDGSAGFGLSVISVQKVPLRKACDINVLRRGASANALNYHQLQLFVDSPGFCPSNERLVNKSILVRQPGV